MVVGTVSDVLRQTVSVLGGSDRKGRLAKMILSSGSEKQSPLVVALVVWLVSGGGAILLFR